MKIKLYNWLAKDLGKLGREGDTELAHVNPLNKNYLKQLVVVELLILLQA